MDTEKYTKQIGLEIFKLMDDSSTSFFNKDWWYGQMMRMCVSNETIKTNMFRFVDVLPSLTTSEEIYNTLNEYFAQDGDLPKIFGFGLGIGKLVPAAVSTGVKRQVNQMGKIFIAGKDEKDALKTLLKLRKNNLHFTLDLLGEATLNKKEAKMYQSAYLNLIQFFSKQKEFSQHDKKIPQTNLSVKLSSICDHIKVTAWEDSKNRIKASLRPILSEAVKNNVFINIDMEHFDLKNITLEVFQEIIMEDEFKAYPHFGIVIQAYLKSSFPDLEELIQVLKKRKIPITVRLVKGAYWDHEVILADQRNWPVPVYTIKENSDYNFEECTKLIIDNHEHINLAIGSHNVRSIAHGIAYANQKKVEIEIQMLHGMADEIKKALGKKNIRIREYVPIGELIPGMAYLVRRLLENTSNESFLLSKFEKKEDNEQLLNKPTFTEEPELPKKLFANEPTLDFAIEKNRKMYLEAMDRNKNTLRECPLIIGGKKIKTGQIIDSINPSNTNEVVGKIHMARLEDVELAVSEAKKAHKSWKNVSANERAKLIEKLADKISEKSFDFATIQTLEVGKPWDEAYADVTEAIDFLRYYAKHMKHLDSDIFVGDTKGEYTKYKYLSKGVCAVIAPWNFPLAILSGMTTASVVAGNTVVMKPAEESSTVASMFMDLANEVLPKGVINYLPGQGETIGKALVEHKDISLIAFTGSKEVGLAIADTASKTKEGQRGVKKCIIEMGGKNSIIIDSNADLDEAVEGVVTSAFGFSGQKCSACSRVIVFKSVYQKFVDRLINTTKSLVQGNTSDPRVHLGPVISEDAFKRINSTIEKSTNTMSYQGEKIEGGYYVPPTIFTECTKDCFVAQTELFGPVLSVIKADNISHAVEIANHTIYGLTGGIYSRSPKNIEYVKENLEVGNIYINRNITGAMVNRHPFGGIKLSGVGSKTGGKDYLLQFLETICITENSTRRGFAPQASHTPSLF